MKNSILLLFVVLFLSSCGDDATTGNSIEVNSVADSLKNENLLLKNQSAEKDANLNEYFKLINEIQDNLNLISEKQGLINDAKGNGEFSRMSESDVVEEIKSIALLTEQLKAKNKQLKSKLKQVESERDNALADNVEFEKMIINLSEDVATKNHEIFMLQQEMENLDAAYSELFIVNEELLADNEELIEDLNKAWFTMGSKKELITNEVLDKEGGVLGLGKSTVLKSDFNREYFTEIDITIVLELPLGAKKASLKTNHPAESYEIVGDKTADKLVIKDATAFWSVSKYLVILLD